jgi:hypothetical protein
MKVMGFEREREDREDERKFLEKTRVRGGEEKKKIIIK